MMLMGSWWDRCIEPSLVGTKASTKMAEVQTPVTVKECESSGEGKVTLNVMFFTIQICRVLSTLWLVRLSAAKALTCV